MTSKSKDRHGIRSGNRFTLNATARAIRSALALGLAVAATGPVFAGTCDVGDPSNATCDGTFTGIGINYAIDDLSLVVGGDSATTIDPLDGVAGIYLYSANGTIDLDSAADIATAYAAGISVRAPYGEIDVANSGSIDTLHGDGIDAIGYSADVTVTNQGDIDAYGSRGIQARSGQGDITVDNAEGASISVYNYYGNATGIEARTYYGDITIVNDGEIDAGVVGYGRATGISASNFYGSNAIVVGEYGDVSASTDNVYGGTATGVKANSVIGGSAVTNYGNIDASAVAEYGDATSYGVLNRGGYYGVTSVVNEGSISSYASTGDGVGWAWGIRERGQDASIDNAGSVFAEAYAGTGYASATASYVRGNYASTVNSGDITAYATVGGSGQALAYGAMTWGYISSSLDNSGSIAAHASTGYGSAVAQGTSAHYDHESSVDNSGDILAEAYATVGSAAAFGVYNYALDVATVTNSATGEITGQSEVGSGYAFGYGAWLDSGYSSTLQNYGSIVADASAIDGGAFGNDFGVARTRGVTVLSRYGDAYLDNAEGATVSAHSGTYGENGHAYAFGAVVQGANIARIENSGEISAEAYAVSGYAISLGDLAYGDFAVNLNYGAVSASSTVLGAGYAQAMGQYAFGAVSTVVNEGEVTALAEVGDGTSNATGARLYGAWVAAYNYGDIAATAHADAGEAGAYGIAAFGFYGSSVYNGTDGVINASASASVGDATAQGINNYAYVYGAYVTNAGVISVEATSGYGNAIAVGVVNTAYLYGHAAVVNDGDISVSAISADAGSAEAIGVYNFGFLYGADVTNTGSISVAASGQGYATASGIVTRFYDGDSMIDNSGAITANASSLGGAYGAAEAIGVSTDYLSGKYNLPDVVLANSGSVSAIATRAGDYGYSSATGASILAMSAEIYNDGSISAIASSDGYFAGANAVGVLSAGKYSAATSNNGGISAQATASHGGSSDAVGLLATSYYGDATLVNYGDIAATSISAFDGSVSGSAYAGGVNLHGDYLVHLYNAGSITAYASADHGTANARGFTGSAKYDTATMSNAGEIIAVASAYGGVAKAIGSQISSKYGASTSNDGLIAAYAYADYYGNAQATGSLTQGPGAHGYFAYAIGASLYNEGEIRAFASADGGQAIAIGARVEGAQDAGASTTNSGFITAIASADGGAAFATGINTWSYYGEVVLENLGEISALAAAGDYGQAVATGSITRAEGFGPPSYTAGSASVTNAGEISATALSGIGGSSWATAARVTGEQGAGVDNSGAIEGSAQGAAAFAYGLVATSAYGDVIVDNSGSIIATSNASAGGTATAVYLGSYGLNTLLNTGDIIATGTGSTHIAVYSSDGASAVVSNYGLVSGSILTGNRDDSLFNHAGGSIVLRNDLIDLGSYSVYGNRFSNEGSVVVRGDANRIDMGQGMYTLVPSLNPLAFVNDGTIDFHDGASDDVLTIAGDFAGHGEINVDVSGLDGSSDLIYVDGSIVDGGAQAVNVWFTGMPTTASSTITVAQVSGYSTAGAFVLGAVHSAVNPGFLALDFGLVADIDASNARPDNFALSVDVSGLNDAGVLAASIATGAQSLMGSQVGTWRQRMGMVGESAKGGVSLWARLFQAKGSIAPDHEAADFGQGGNFDFEQKNSGVEAGVDFAVTDEFSLGLLLAKADADQHLRGAGAGSSRIEGDTWGAYATWISPAGFYLDGSYRRMGFTASTGALSADGNADTFNLEGGYAWTLEGGLKLEPQLQYTHTSVSDIDAMSLGATELRLADGDSSVGRVGLMLSKRFDATAGGWTWTPYGAVSALREFDGSNGYAINGDFHGSTSTGGNSALVEAGFSAQTGKLSLSAGLNWRDGGALDSFLGGQLNLRYSW